MCRKVYYFLRHPRPSCDTLRHPLRPPKKPYKPRVCGRGSQGVARLYSLGKNNNSTAQYWAHRATAPDFPRLPEVLTWGTCDPCDPCDPPRVYLTNKTIKAGARNVVRHFRSYLSREIYESINPYFALGCLWNPDDCCFRPA